MSKEELRSESRLALEMTIHIQEPSSAEGGQDPGNFQVAKTLNISAKGIQIQLDTRMAVMSTLQLRIQMKDHNRPFRLAGEVRWTYQDPVDPKRYLAGLRLLDAGQADNKRWQDYVNFRLKHNTG